MNIVFVLGSYYPDFSAVGHCVNNVAIELSKKHNVTVISKRTRIPFNNSFYIGNVKVLTIDSSLINLRLFTQNKLKSSNFIFLFFYRFFLILLKTGDFLFNKMPNKLFNPSDIKNYHEVLRRLHLEKRIDIVVPCVNPFESCMAAIKFKNEFSNVKLVSYMFDTLVDNKSFYRNSTVLKKLYLKHHLKAETKLFALSDRVICMKHYAKCVKKNHTLSNNLFVVEHPLLIKKDFKIISKTEKKIRLVYTGVLYKDIRNPVYILKILTKLFKLTSEVEVHFYGGGDCNRILTEFQKLFPQNFYFHGVVSGEEAQEAQGKSDALLSLGNSTNFQLPSKTFEYMSMLKPIVHIANNENDLTIDILSKYKTHIIFYESNTDHLTSAKKLLEFLNKKTIPMTFNELKMIFYDAEPEYTANIITRLN